MKIKTQTESTNLKFILNVKLIKCADYPQDTFNPKPVHQTGVVSHWFYPGGVLQDGHQPLLDASDQF